MSNGNQPDPLEARVKALEDGFADLTRTIAGQDGDLAWLARTGIPIGSIVAFAGDWPPAGVDANNQPWTEDSLGWILCDSRPLNDPKYAALSQALGRQTAPDLRGVFMRGFNPGPGGVDLGRQLGDLQAEDLKSHTHPATSATTFSHSHKLAGWAAMGDAQGGGNNEVIRTPTYGNAEIGTSDVVSGAPTTNTTIYNEGGPETRPINVSVNYVIRFRAVQ